VVKYDYLIIGGGMTADAAARGIRERDKKGSIGIIASEPDTPYNRPPLTKGLWKGDAPDSIWRKTNETGADLRNGRRATRLEPAEHRVTDDKNETYQYGKLLLATGGTPRRLPGAPDGIIYYRTVADYRRTRDLASHGASFLVLGGGFIGTEIAAGIRMQGRAVTMVVPEPGLGARIFPADLSRFVTDYYRKKGVTVKTGASVEKIEKHGDKFTAQVKGGGADGTSVDAVIAGLGITPNVELAQQAGLKVNDGIEVDELLHTSARDVFAAGDAAKFFNPALGKQIRVEHEDNANTMGKIAGENMAGANQHYDHLPFFYSDLFELGYEAVGEVDSRLESFADWKTEFREGVVFYLDSGRVRGVLLWNIFGQVDAARALIAERGPFGPQQLKGRLPA
jgi:NADPH-dependent 2,4-dienoyl-CoA reductase/sulfur reductase-like enzyme